MNSKAHTHTHTHEIKQLSKFVFCGKTKKITIIIYRIEPNSIWGFDDFEKVLYNFVSIRYRKLYYISCFHTIMKYKCLTLNVFSAVFFFLFSSAPRNTNQNTQTNIAHRTVEQHLSLAHLDNIRICSQLFSFFLQFFVFKKHSKRFNYEDIIIRNNKCLH